MYPDVGVDTSSLVVCSAGLEAGPSSAPPARTIRVSVTKLSGELVGLFDILATDKVEQLKRELLKAKALKGPSTHGVGLTLVHGGEVLPGHVRLSDAGVADGASLQMIMVVQPVQGFTVVARVRPLTTRERALGRPLAVFEAAGPSLGVVLPPPEERTRQVALDAVYSEAASQEEVFDGTVRGVVEGFMQGMSGTVIAYGQTGTGKTHTMLDPDGMLPRALDYIAARIEETPHTRCVVRSSVIELRGERVFDLAAAEGAERPEYGLRVRESKDRGVYVEGLSKHVARSAQDLHGVLATALERHRAEIGINPERAEETTIFHFIFTVELDAYEAAAEGSVLHSSSRLTMVDLRPPVPRQRQPRGSPLREGGAAITLKSLPALSNCLAALRPAPVSGRRRPRLVPHRDSRLTFLLKESLGGRTHTVFIVTCSPAEECAEETFSTMRLAKLAKAAESFPQVRQSRKELSPELAAEIEELKWQPGDAPPASAAAAE